jgi:hypothetical protein
MRVGIVGGLDRNEGAYERLAESLGHEVEHHTGVMRGTAGSELESLVKRSDLVVILTDVNSHAAVKMTRKLLSTHPRPSVLMRRLGPSRLSALLREHAATASE